MSAGSLINETQNINFNHLHNNHYKFLSELNSTSKRKRETEYIKKRHNEIKQIEYNELENKESKENNCEIF